MKCSNVILFSALMLSIVSCRSIKTYREDKVDKLPAFNYIDPKTGKELGFHHWYQMHIIFPDKPGYNYIDDEFVAEVVIDRVGAVRAYKIVQGVDSLLDSEAIRLIKMMPRWKPAEKNGKPVNVRYELSIIFYQDLKGERIGFGHYEEMPVFTKGNAQKWIAENLKYPKNARKNKIEGKVYVQFVIEKTGKVSNIKTVRGVEENLDKEAVRLIKSMPKWIPGKMRGRPCRVSYTIPVKFELN